MDVVKRIARTALVALGITVAGILVAGSASAAPGTSPPGPVTTQSHVLSLLCLLVFAVLIVGGGLLLIGRRGRGADASEVVPTPPGSGLTMTHSQRDYQRVLEGEDEDEDDDPASRLNRRGT